MSNDNVFKLIQPGIFEDRLAEVLRNGARALPDQAVESEVCGFIASQAASRRRTAFGGLCGTAIFPSGR